MAAQAAHLTADEFVSDPRGVLELVVDRGRPVVVESNGTAVAQIKPVRSPARRRPDNAGYQAFLATAGGWKEHVDVEQFKRDNAESRRLSRRPPVRL